MNLYYDLAHLNWYKKPDWFGVVGVAREPQGQSYRNSYVMWQEKVTPIIILEMLSPGTEKEDLGQTQCQANQPPTKWQVYEQILKVPNYVVFDESTQDLRLFQLVDG